MRLLALSQEHSDDPSTRTAASFALHRWLTRLGHAVSWVAVASMPVLAVPTRVPHVSLSAPYATRQLVRLARQQGSDGIVGLGEPTADAIAREACAALGIVFIEAMGELEPA
jgi:hypothetical protein